MINRIWNKWFFSDWRELELDRTFQHWEIKRNMRILKIAHFFGPILGMLLRLAKEESRLDIFEYWIIRAIKENLSRGRNEH